MWCVGQGSGVFTTGFGVSDLRVLFVKFNWLGFVFLSSFFRSNLLGFNFLELHLLGLNILGFMWLGFHFQGFHLLGFRVEGGESTCTLPPRSTATRGNASFIAIGLTPTSPPRPPLPPPPSVMRVMNGEPDRTPSGDGACDKLSRSDGGPMRHARASARWGRAPI